MAMTAALLAVLAGLCVLLAIPSRAVRIPEPVVAAAVSGRSPVLGRGRTGWMLGGVGAVLVAWLIHPVVVAVGGGIVLGVPRWRARVSRAKTAGLRVRALPGTLDLLAVALGAGGTISAGLRVVASRGDDAVRPVFEQILLRRQSGQSLLAVLSGVPDELGEPYRPLVRALVATERDGAPIASLLVRLAEEAETSRRRAAEARAKHLSVQLLFPLVTCFLPAVLLGAVVPLVIVAAGRFLT